MKLLINRQFPHNLITGIFLFKEFDTSWPTQLKVITDKKRDPEFQESVNTYFAAFPHKEDIPVNYKRLADDLNVTIKIRKDDNSVDSFGSGKILR